MGSNSYSNSVKSSTDNVVNVMLNRGNTKEISYLEDLRNCSNIEIF